MSAEHRLPARWWHETIYRVVQAWPSERSADGSGRAVTWQVRLADGSSALLDGGDVCEQVSNEHGERILLTVERAAHVLARHKQHESGERGRGGVFAAGVTITRLLRLFRYHHHQALGQRYGSIQVNCERLVGTSAVVSASEMAERGVLSDADLAQLEQLKEEVFAAGVWYSDAERSAFLERVNEEWRGRNVRLQERNGVLLPVFVAEPQPTRSFVIVLSRARRRDPRHQDASFIRTIYPGELLCPSPANGRFTPLSSVSLLPVGTTIPELYKRRDEGEVLSKREQYALASYRKAFEVWYEHGPLMPAWLVERRSQRQRDRERSASAGGVVRSA